MELTVLLTQGETSFSHAKDTAIPRIVLEEVKKAASVRMCKVQDTMCQITKDTRYNSASPLAKGYEARHVGKTYPMHLTQKLAS
jgi:hypothetical protein